MAYADQEMSGNKVTAFIIVALIHIAIGYGLISGLAYEAVEKIAERVTTVDIEEPPPPEDTPPPPPPEPVENVAPPPPFVPKPKTNLNPNPPTESRPTPDPFEFNPLPSTPSPTATPTFRPTPTPTPTASQARPATPRNQARWASRIDRNYPNRAQREGREGTVGMRLTIGANGRVSGCTVTNSSGHSDLDRAACDGMQRYGEFNPALNDAGNAIAGTHNISFVYRLQ